MSTSNDPLANLEAPDRVFYATGALLDSHDFNAEQTYHRGRLARAMTYLHGSGTAAGLRVLWEPHLDPGEDPNFLIGREECLMVEPGLAIDRLGRMIEVPRAACIRLDRWYRGHNPDSLIRGLHANGVVVDLFVRFVTCERGKTPAFAAGPFDALDAVIASRLRDGYELELVVREEADPPLPENQWPDLAAIVDINDRRAALHTAILDAWREGTEWQDGNGLVPLPEHAVRQDTTFVFLARIVLPASPEDSEGARPERTPDAVVTVDNEQRPFVYTAGAVARWHGI